MIKRHTSRLKGLAYLTIVGGDVLSKDKYGNIRSGTVLAKAPFNSDIYFPVVFTQFVTENDLTEEEYDCIYRLGSKLKQGATVTFPDDRHRILWWDWKAHKWSWNLINDRKSPITWDIIHQTYL